MKLASLKSTRSRDGELCIVNRLLTAAIRVPHIASTLQYALDHWDVVEPKLQLVYQQLMIIKSKTPLRLLPSYVPRHYPVLINGPMAVPM
ncbi:hypothetical protein MXE25_07190 [Legionella pneumophila]|nr:hypothetical protein [Legionella pneumophila]MCK0181026.1 hypothetical protein [Legionella pneumophila]MCK1879658.1 hypothetical protein [Legionella pneumophila]